MPDEATNSPVPGDFIADQSPLEEELDAQQLDAAAEQDGVDAAAGEAEPDEANESMDPPLENIAEQSTADEAAASKATTADDATSAQDPASEVVPDEANASMDPATDNLADELVSRDTAPDEPAEQPVERPRRRRAASRPAGPPVEVSAPAEVPVTTAAAATTAPADAPAADTADAPAAQVERPRRKRATRPAGAAAPVASPDAPAAGPASTDDGDTPKKSRRSAKADDAAPVKDTGKKKDADAKKDKRARKSRRDEADATAGDAAVQAGGNDTAEATVFPDGAVISQRKPVQRRRRGASSDEQSSTQTTTAEATTTADAPAGPAPDEDAALESTVGAAGEGTRGERSSRRRRGGRRQGAPEPETTPVAEDDVAAALAQRVADAAPVQRPGGEVAADERDRALQDLVAALSAGTTGDATSDEPADGAGAGVDSAAPDDTDASHETESTTVSDDDTDNHADSDHDADNDHDADGDDDTDADTDADSDGENDDEAGDRGSRRRRRRRGGRRRRRGSDSDDAEGDDSDEQDAEDGEPASGNGDDESGEDTDTDDESGDDSTEGEQGDGSRRRRRRRRRRGEDTSGADDDPTEVVVRLREPRSAKQVNDEVTGIEGSTRMEAKRQRRKEGRAAGRSRRPILSEAEFLSRRESVNRKLLIRQRDDYTQLAVLEDDVLVEHYVDRASATSLIGNIYLGRIQNVLPSMEAVFIDIGRGRNAVLYAGEVDWDSYGAVGSSKKVEQVFKSGQTVLVQVTKDPVGAKGARLTNHVSLPGRYVVYSPGGHLSGISRKLADTERHRLRDILGDLVSDDESVIVRTAAEGASEEELVRDVNRLKAQWEAIQKKVKQGSAPQLLYAEPDLTVRIVRDLFTEDFDELLVQGNGSADDAFDSIEAYVSHVAPHLHERVKRFDAEGADLFSKYRIDEQIAKALERKVFLPSGGSLVIDRTEAMTVIDVNTGKFTGSGGNLEATVTSNNLEAAEEIVRQLRLRDIGGIIVVDFIDMVLPNNRELLLRRLVECLGRDRTRHQVAEVTSLGLVQMTRKKIGTGLAEAFTEQCDCCGGRGYVRHDEPVESQAPADGGERRSGTSTSRRGGRRRSSKGDGN